MFEETRALDPILLLTGSGALPYMEKGTLAPGSTMDTAGSVLGSGMLACFLWFNQPGPDAFPDNPPRPRPDLALSSWFKYPRRPAGQKDRRSRQRLSNASVAQQLVD